MLKLGNINPRLICQKNEKHKPWTSTKEALIYNEIFTYYNRSHDCLNPNKWSRFN